MSEFILIKIFKMIPKLSYCDENNCNILHHLVSEGNKNLIKKFLERALYNGELNNIINKKNNEQLTPLHYAVKTNQQEISQLLINYGADIDIKDPNGNIIKWNQSGGGKKIKICGFRKI